MTSAIASDTTDADDRVGTIEDLVDRFGRFGRSPVTMLAIWAHPDDESYLGGGLMAEVARRGGRVVNVTATLGEHGTQDPELDPPHALAARRQVELAGALGVLGATEHHVLGFADGACDQIADALGARRIGTIIDEVQPDVVLGFGPDGVTGHPDHRAVGRWTRDAIRDRRRPIPLLTTAAGAAWPADLLEPSRRTGAFWPGFPERRVTGPSWTITLDEARLEQKLDALRCHRSQIGALHEALGAHGYRRLAAHEAYRVANPAAAQFLSPGRRRTAS